MSTISDKISVKKPVIPEQTNVPLDARTVCDSVADFPNIELPYIGMIVFTKSDGKYWKITELKEKQIGFISVADAQIATYEEFDSGSSSAKYTPGDGIQISEKNAISVDFETVAKKGDIVKYTSGTGIKIENNVITCTLEIKEYSAGDGLQLVGSAFEVDWLKVAKKSDIKSYSSSDNITVGSDGKIDVTGKVALKTDIPRSTMDYNELSNKPVLEGGDNVTIETMKALSLIVSGAGDTMSNGTYEMVDYTKSGTERVWQKEGRKFYHNGTRWVIDDDMDSASFYYSATGTADPWTLTFTAAISSVGSAPTVALGENGAADKHIVKFNTSVIEPKFCTVQSVDEEAGTVVVLAEDGNTYTLRYKMLQNGGLE